MFRRIARLTGAAALSAGMLAVPASVAFAAPAYVDTSLQASGFTGASQQTNCSAPVSAAVAGSGSKSMSFTARGTGDTFSAATFSPGAGGTATAAISANGTLIQVTGVSGTTTSADTLKFKITNSGGCISVETASITEVAGSLTETDSLDVVVLSASPQSFVTNDNTTGGVVFHAAGSSALAAFAVSNLPAGLSGSIGLGELLPGTAVPGQYSDVRVAVTDAAGAVAQGEFNLLVIGNQAATPYGNNVNPFGNGFDVWQQRAAVNTVIAGWRATMADPATHFLQEPGTVSGAYRYEYAPNGTGTGLCVSNPGGGYVGDPGGPTGLVLRGCNLSVFQQFRPGSGHELISVVNGQVVNPNGAGAQLSTGASRVSWGGSAWTWKDDTSLPA
jgi:hypothetical protein